MWIHSKVTWQIFDPFEYSLFLVEGHLNYMHDFSFWLGSNSQGVLGSVLNVLRTVSLSTFLRLLHLGRFWVVSWSFSTLGDCIDGLDKRLCGSLIIIHGEFLTQSATLSIFVILWLSLSLLRSVCVCWDEPHAASEVQLLCLTLASDVSFQ